MFHSERQRASAGPLTSIGGPGAGGMLAIAMAAWLVSAGPVQAQPAQPAAGLSYEQALQRAGERAPLLAARRATLDAATQLRTSAGQLPDPRLTVGLVGAGVGVTIIPETVQRMSWKGVVYKSIPRATVRLSMVHGSGPVRPVVAAFLAAARKASARQ